MSKYKLTVAAFLISIVAGSTFAATPLPDWIPTMLIVGGVCGLFYVIIHAAMDD